jgi:hypothetical protein
MELHTEYFQQISTVARVLPRIAGLVAFFNQIQANNNFALFHGQIQ